MEHRFIGRERELERLESIYSETDARGCAVIGGRRSGKTALLQEFIKDKKALMIRFSDRSRYENLVGIRRGMSEYVGDEAPEFDTICDALFYIARICVDSDSLLVIDDVHHYLNLENGAKTSFREFVSAMRIHNSGMILISGLPQPLHEMIDDGDGTTVMFRERINLKGLTLGQSLGFHDGMPAMDALKTYLTVGGSPCYHVLMDRESFDESLIRCFLDCLPVLDDEPERLLGQLPNPIACSGILACIANGVTSQIGISRILSIDKGNCSRLIGQMAESGLIARWNPMLDAPRKPVYYIRNCVCAFHYEVLQKHDPKIRNPLVDGRLKLEMISGNIRTFLAERFTLACMEYVQENYRVVNIGQWWRAGDESDTKVDMIANVLNDRGELSQIVGSCVFSEDRCGTDVLEELQRRTEMMGSLINFRFALFSASGFDDELIERSKGGPIILIGLDKLTGKSPADDIEELPVAGQIMLEEDL